MLSTLSFQLSTQAQGTAFTYQGRLNDGANPANGKYDLTFALFSTSSGAAQVGSTVTNLSTTVSNGLFSVTLVFGGVFTGPARWLEIAAGTNGSGTLTVLSPPQPLTPVPCALVARNRIGALSASPLSGALPSGVFARICDGAVTLTNPGNGIIAAPTASHRWRILLTDPQ